MKKVKEKNIRMNNRKPKMFFWKVSSGWKILKACVKVGKHNSLPQKNLSSVLSDGAILYKNYSIRPLLVLVTITGKSV